MLARCAKIYSTITKLMTRWLPLQVWICSVIQKNWFNGVNQCSYHVNKSSKRRITRGARAPRLHAWSSRRDDLTENLELRMNKLNLSYSCSLQLSFW
jgi:hypothetical protein